MTSQPAIVIVPGSFTVVSQYDKIVSAIREQGFQTVKVVDLASTGKKDPPATLQDDVDAIRAVVEPLADEGRDILLVPHSYGGIPASQSIEDTSSAARAQSGKKGGVVHLLYTTSVVPALGESSSSTLGSGDNEDDGRIVMDGAYLTIVPEKIAAATFSDMSLEDGLFWTKKFTQHSAATFATPLTYAGYKDVPVTWYFAESDHIITPGEQRKMIDNIEQARGEKIEVLKYDVGHVPHISKPETVVDAIKRVVGKLSAAD